MIFRRLNLALAIVWAILTPVSLWQGWTESVTFVSLASLYANAATHLAGWRADVPT